ncbi:GNAT family N-acetyltransferase [Bifidobacterium sp. ESL0763]|uniref:GNAT family N-acetyltransferase n=1 Tax=Bifidobacterium sp. ESL0763 TaxID=2983227 RepID=UPI0023F8534E|nr:GNAT family N-acetyltransferase [Bifidobacterium sp. ESL0763]MDF7663765.1 GNAT family N-acetyltransferase [Bifidobacterium sp. ESL0763]
MPSLGRAWALGQAALLDAELFGEDAWSRDEICYEFDAPDRVYLADVVLASDVLGQGSDGVADTGPAFARPTEPMAMRGYAGMWCAEGTAQILTVDVARNHQRQGVGRTLLRALLDEARRRGTHRVSLQVRVGNSAALGLYCGFGFTTARVLRNYYGKRDGDAYELTLGLGPNPVGFASGAVGRNKTDKTNRINNTNKTNDMASNAPAIPAEGRTDDE